MRKGGLWNTFITIGRAGTFLKLLNVTVRPTLARLAEAIACNDLDSVYEEIEAIDFSKHVLSVAPRDLLVMADGASGWADLGNQARVIDTLDRHEMEPEWLREMRRSNILAGLNRPVRMPQNIRRTVMQDIVTV
jgi:hypothetical protein